MQSCQQTERANQDERQDDGHDDDVENHIRKNFDTNDVTDVIKLFLAVSNPAPWITSKYVTDVIKQLKMKTLVGSFTLKIMHLES